MELAVHAVQVLRENLYESGRMLDQRGDETLPTQDRMHCLCHATPSKVNLR